MAALSTGVFLACSWTWCIGMFLPALLIGDFGWPAWIVFAIPNIVGAAAMGVVLRDRGPAVALRERRLPAAVWFSWVTIAFHIFFLGWVASEWLTLPALRFAPDAPDLIVRAAAALGNPMVTAPVFVGVVFLAGVVISGAGFRGLRRIAWPVWIGSVLLVAIFAIRYPPEGLPGDASLLAGPTGASHWSGLIWLAPVCVFGFALCPYLDLTFLRARIETPGGAGSAAFILGFGFFFLVMIALTLLYAGGVVQFWHLSGWVIAHIAIQSAFTIGAHLREVRLAPWPRRPILRAIGALAPLAAIAIPVLLYQSMRAEGAYRAFMGAYGLVFPAYVWLGLGGGKPARGTLATFAIVCCLAAPLYWLGFVQRDWWALGPGLAIALVGGGVAVWRKPRP